MGRRQVAAEWWRLPVELGTAAATRRTSPSRTRGINDLTQISQDNSSGEEHNSLMHEEVEEVADRTSVTAIRMTGFNTNSSGVIGLIGIVRRLVQWLLTCGETVVVPTTETQSSRLL